MTLLVLVLLVVCLVFPIGLAWRVWRLDEPSLFGWILAVANASVFVALIMLVGRWDMAGYYCRFVLLAVFAAAVLRSLGRHARRPWRPADGSSVWKSRWTTAVSLLLFGGALAYVVSGMLPPSGARDFAFPLQNGRFMVAQGGGIGLLNRHAGHTAQRHAADITAVNVAGFRAAGMLPKELGRYAIYGAPVVSPCHGAVVSAKDGLPDLVPPQRDGENAAGNHVVIDCGGVNVELAHLQKGSVLVAAGERLAPGDAVGKVGNSGNTTEPHLHIHAVDRRTGTGVPMSFDARAPVRNRLYEN